MKPLKPADSDPSTMSLSSRRLPPPPQSALAAELGSPEVEVSWLAGDGSDRCYYRVRPISAPSLSQGKSYVLMQLSQQDQGVLKNEEYDWLKIGSYLAKQGVRVPKAFFVLPEHAAIIIDDYGDQTFEQHVKQLFKPEADQSAVRNAYASCFAIILKFLQMKQNPAEAWCKRVFDTERYRFETDFFMHHFGKPIAGITLSPSEEEAYRRDLDRLSSFLSGYSKFFVHRDFHSRNLMVTEGGLAVIDFQDARIGSQAYDLVSLCFDSYVPLSLSLRCELMETAIDLVAKSSGDNLGKGTAQAIREHWQACILQRQLKAIGSFGYLTIVKNRGNYLKYVKPALETIPKALVFDERWPFLSGTLLDKLKSFTDS